MLRALRDGQMHSHRDCSIDRNCSRRRAISSSARAALARAESRSASASWSVSWTLTIGSIVLPVEGSRMSKPPAVARKVQIEQFTTATDRAVSSGNELAGQVTAFDQALPGHWLAVQVAASWIKAPVLRYTKPLVQFALAAEVIGGCAWRSDFHDEIRDLACFPDPEVGQVYAYCRGVDSESYEQVRLDRGRCRC